MSKIFSSQESPAEIDFSKYEFEEPRGIPHESLTFWLPADKKAKFDRIQSKTKRKYGKDLKRLLIQAIDKTPDIES